ncbi:hypothetical protein BT96DRAFT_927620, partial [Gymnopus androsaceus JB14]
MPRFSNFAVVFSMLLFIQASMMTVQAMPSSERRTAAPRMCVFQDKLFARAN